MSPIADAAARARALVYCVITGAFAALFLYITLRFAQDGDAVETLMLAALTAGLSYQTWRWFRRARGLGRTGPRR